MDVNGYYPDWDPEEDVNDYDGGQVKLVFRDDIIYPPRYNIHFYEQGEEIYKEMYRIDLNGGHGIFNTEQEYYQAFFFDEDWIKRCHYDLFMDMSHPMIYAFNPNADLNEISKAISGRHSDFSFEHGYRITDFGIENFSNKSKFETIDELFEVYRTNTEAYNNLVNKMIYEADSRDKMVVMKYIFNKFYNFIYYHAKY